MKGEIVFLVLACLMLILGTGLAFSNGKDFSEANGPAVIGTLMRLAALMVLGVLGMALLRACGCADGEGSGGDADDR